MRSPVLLIAFNRPDCTEKVFAEIAKAKPPILLVFADGPRVSRSDDPDKCAEARAVTERVNWDCRVFRKYSDVNLGCGHGPANAISWALDQFEHAIILEDDCVPHPTFFQFCDDILVRYRNDTRVMHVAGNNFQLGQRRTSFSYFFSYHNICAGGWATWRRAWRHFDMELKLWPILRDTSFIEDIVGDHRASAHWRTIFEDTHGKRGKVDYWDYQWTFACWAQNGLSILPNATLVSNVGFGHPEATHTRSTNDNSAKLTACLATEAMPFPLDHPLYVRRHQAADVFFVNRIVLPSLHPRCRYAFPAFLEHTLRRRVSASIPRARLRF